MKWRLVKLVRDNVQKHVPGDVPEVEYKPFEDTPDETYIGLLIKKLGEETVEFLCDSSLEELTDVFTVVLTLGDKLFNMTPQQMFDEAAKKNKRMGKFDLGMAMFVQTLTREEFDEQEYIRNREREREREGKA